jgi:adenylate cyclase
MKRASLGGLGRAIVGLWAEGGVEHAIRECGMLGADQARTDRATMQHKDRKKFRDAIEHLVEATAESPLSEIHKTRLRQGLDGLIDEFLLESQPIVATQATIVLADIRGFTALTESLPTETVITLLNRYFTTMACVVQRRGGVIDKFMGDAVMALFGVPEHRPDDLLRAVACAVEMQLALAELNLEAEACGEPRLFAGVAVNTGPVMAGSFGSREYSEYTVIGDTVNVVARMEPFSLRGQILLSESTLEGARDHVRIGGTNRVRVKGKSRPLTLYELRAISHPQRLTVPQVEARRSPRVQVDFPVLLQRVAAKRVLSASFNGRARDLGYHGMLVELPLELPPCADLAVSLLPGPPEEPIAELDAKVVRVTPRKDGFATSLQFTSVDTPAHGRIKDYVDLLLWGP